MRTRLAAPALLIAAAVSLSAQDGQTSQDPQPPVFRTEADFIRVDMYPTANGQFVTDLRPDEVEIYEDGVRQQVETFERVGIPRDRAAGPARDEGGEHVARNRVYVVFVDTHTTALEREPGLRIALVRFLDQLLGPDDLVGLMTPDMSALDVTLGRRATVISDIANDRRWLERAAPRTKDLQDFAWENCYPSPRGVSSRLNEMRARRNARNTIEALQELVVHLRDIREERKAVLLVSGGWPFQAQSALYSGGAVETEACATDRIALSRVNYGNLLEDLARSANRANVSFYPVNSRPKIEPARDLPAQVRVRILQNARRTMEDAEDQLNGLAEETDGLAGEGIRNFDAVTQRIIADTSSYYLLGYQSSNAKTDGKFRSITVRVNRPGVRIRARRGYGGAPPRIILAEPPARALPVVDSRVTNALATVQTFDVTAPFWGRSAAWDSSGAEGGSFWYVGELGTQARSQGSWDGGTSAEIVVVGPDRTEVMTRTMNLPSSETTFAVRVPEHGVLPQGEYSVRVRLSPGGDEEASVHDLQRVRLGAAQGPGEAHFWRSSTLPRAEFRRTADPRFRRTERLRLELPTMVAAPPAVRLLDRFGQPMQNAPQVTTRADESGGFSWVVIDTTLATLAPGDYVIEVVQENAARITAFKIVP